MTLLTQCNIQSAGDDAETLAQRAAEDAGWRIRWPRIRMMSQSPDLAHTAPSSSNKDDGDDDDGAKQPKRAATKSSTWSQLRRFVAEVTEVFGQSGSVVTPLTSSSSSQLPLDEVTEQHVQADMRGFGARNSNGSGGSRIRSFIGNSSSSSNSDSESDSDDDDDDDGMGMSADHRTNVANVRTRWQACVEFGRQHPLMALMLGWLVMLVVDWTVTSSVVPRLLSLLTSRPWSPFSEAFVMRASLIVDDTTNNNSARVVRLIRRRLLSGELWVDEFLWTVQLFVCDTLVPMTRPYAVHWLCFALVSLKILMRCSKVGTRAVLLYALCFVLSDLALWRIMGTPSSLAPSSVAEPPFGAGKLAPAVPFPCSGDFCVSPESQTLSGDVETTTNTQQQRLDNAVPGVLQIPPQHVYSPFADAVAEALARKRAHVERRRERIHGLHEWRRRQKQQQQQQQQLSGSTDNAGSRLLSLLATLAVYGYVASRVRHVGASAVHLCMALLALDVISRTASLGGSCNSNGEAVVQRVWETLWPLRPRLLLRSGVSGLNSAMFWLGGRGVSAFPRVHGTWGCLLPIHALSTFAMLAMHELAFIVHSMRVWYATTIRDRRRGPAMVSAQTALNSSNTAISLCSALAVAAAGSDSDSGSDFLEVTTKRPEKNGGGEKPVLTLSQVAGRARAPYAHRVCFLCLSGFCERCLLSMNIWPTRPTSETGGDAAVAGGPDFADLHSPGDASGGPASLSSPNSRRRSRGHGRHTATAKSADAMGLADTEGGGGGGGLPPLRETLVSLGLLSPAQAAEIGAPHTVPANGGNSGRRGKTVDMWIASSVAHCPCRAVHGVGPSSFVSRAAKLEYMQGANKEEDVGNTCDADEFVPPRGTLVALAQYARELKSLGLVRAVDPASVVFGDDDENPASSVLPLIFGRFTMPANPRAVAAANALLASSATSYAQLMQQRQSSSTSSSGHVPASSPFLQKENQPARILAKPTPLSLARAPLAGTFRLCAESASLFDGVVRVYVVVTPTLAHLLLTHPRTSPTASVCVPASLASVMATRARHHPAKPQSISAATSRIADADPFLDHVRVQLARSDIVVRVNGARWSDVSLPSLAHLNQSIAIRGLSANSVHRICVSICGLRSDELTVVLPSPEARVCRARLAKRQSIQRAQNELHAAESVKADTAHRLKRAKRDMPRQVQHWRNELESLYRAIDKHKQHDVRANRRVAQLDEGIRVLDAELVELRAQHEKKQLTNDADSYNDDDDAVDDVDEEEEEEQPTVFDDRVGFNVLTRLNDADTSSDHTHITTGERYSSDRSSPQQQPDKRALRVLHRAESEARLQQSTLEDRLQSLKAERSRWMSTLSRATQQHKPIIHNTIDPLKQALADTTRRIAQATKTMERLAKQLGDHEQMQLGEEQDKVDRRGAEEKRAMLVQRIAELRRSLKDEQEGIRRLSGTSTQSMEKTELSKYKTNLN
ncbi:hypothetical protein IWW50_000088 [Coemansia erecta]|nr:hypothetical protein IWW50_000088 [Coemansia erecta]